jgi:uncharacterized protein (TIGR03086 family)
MSRIDDCQRALDGARAMIASVRPDELATATPCEGWDVRALLNHMIGVCQQFASMLRGETLDPSFGNADLAGDDPAGAYGRAADDLMAEWRAPGALDKTLDMPFGQMPAALGVRIVISDQTIHTWDLAKALGRPHTMDENLAAGTFELMKQRYDPAQRGPGKAFAQAVECPEDAPLQDRLIALSGRRP